MTGSRVTALPVISATLGMRLMMGMMTNSANTMMSTTNHWSTTKSFSPRRIAVGSGSAVPSGIIAAILGSTTTDIRMTTRMQMTSTMMG